MHASSAAYNGNWSDSQIASGRQIMSRAAARKKPSSTRRATLNVKPWKLEDAKARLSEVVRLAGTVGPQWVTVRGKEAAVVLAPEQYKRLLPPPKEHQPLISFLQGIGLADLNIERDHDTGRQVSL
jgi:antitoxin Phd